MWISTLPNSAAPDFAAGSTGKATSIANWELLAPFAGARAAVPALYVFGDRDLTMGFRGAAEQVANFKELVSQLRKTIMLPGCGHWTQQERAREVNQTMIAFLRDI